MRRATRRMPLVVAVGLSAMACSVSWNALSLDPRPAPSAFVGAEVRVVRTDGETFVARAVRIENDSVVYDTPGVQGSRPALWPKVPPARVAIALAEVRSLEVRSVREVRNRQMMWGALFAVGLVIGIDAYSDCWACQGGW